MAHASSIQIYVFKSPNQSITKHLTCTHIHTPLTHSHRSPLNRRASVGKLLRRGKSSLFHFTPQWRCVTDAPWSHSRWWCVCPASGCCCCYCMCLSGACSSCRGDCNSSRNRSSTEVHVNENRGGCFSHIFIVCSHRELHIYLINAMPVPCNTTQ